MDYSMNLFINVVRTIFILIAGSFLHHYLNEKKIRFTRFRGRMNRKHFFLWLILLTTFHYITSSIGHMFMEQVVTLVEYWFLRITAIVVLILFTPFYLSMYIRRLHDMALVGTLGAIVTFIFLLSTCYEVVRSTSMIYNTILIILNLLLLFIPGTKYRNGFGEPDAWPRKQIKDIQAKGFLRAILDSNIEQSEKQIPIRSDINHYRKTKQVSTPKQREKNASRNINQDKEYNQ